MTRSKGSAVIGHRSVGSAATGRLGLCTDLYELRMTQSYLARGMTRPATFSLFVRPSSRRPWYVALGVQRALELLEAFSFGDEELDYLATIGVDESTRAWLADLPDSSEVWAVPDGTVVLAQEPVLELTAPLPVAQLLETAVMNVVQYPTMVATKAARCALAAGGRRLADFGFRRAHGLETGVEAAIAAFVGGGFATSNVEAGRRFGLPVTGTMAHSYVQAFEDEEEAFLAFASDHPDNSILLVDTYDTVQGVHRAIDACRRLRVSPKGIRIDSGDLGELATTARKLLDEAGFEDTAIFVSGSLDEVAIHELVADGRPVDGFGVGTSLTVSQDHPGLDIVYKLVEYDGRPVAKFSGTKSTYPGRKQVHRPDGDPSRDVLDLRGVDGPGRPLLEPVWQDGRRLGAEEDLQTLRARVQEELATLPESWRLPPYVEEPPLPALGDALQRRNEELRERFVGRG